MTTLTLPRVHLNGTSKKELIDTYMAAYEAVTAAHGAVCGASPNARDYYVQSDTAFRRAQIEHVERLNKLQNVRDELSAIIESLT